MANEILDDVKMHVEGSLADNHFDSLLVSYTNTAFMVLWQLGVGPEDPFTITMASDKKWTDFLDDPSLELVKEYIYRRVQLLFDPPQNSNAMEASKNILEEMEWRIHDYANYKESF